MKSVKIVLKLSVSILFVMLILCLVVSIIYAQNNKNTITFDNQSGEQALVKLVGPTAQTIEVPNGQSRKVNAAAGEYYILARYGSTPEHYRYSKGDPFTVRETETQYSTITISLHKVIDGNYPAHPSSQEEFDRAISSKTDSRNSSVIYQAQKRLKELGYNPGPLDGLWGSKTEASILWFQKDRDLAITGRLDKKTRNELGLQEASNSDFKKFQRQRDSYGFTKIKHDEIWISSIPEGLKIYLLLAKGDVPLDSIFKDKNFKGQTPISIKVQPGSYLIGIERIYPLVKICPPTASAWSCIGAEEDYPFYGDKDNLRKDDMIAKTKLITGISFNEGKILGFHVGRLYLIKKEVNEPSKLVALHYMKDTTFDSLDKLYPDENTFSFNDTRIIGGLSEKGITKQKINEILPLLHRGGKIAFRGRDKNTIVVEILGENKWNIYEIREDKIVKSN